VHAVPVAARLLPRISLLDLDDCNLGDGADWMALAALAPTLKYARPDITKLNLVGSFNHPRTERRKTAPS
jgi:hypothetical protein